MNEHYFAAEPAARMTRLPVTADVWGRRLDLVSASGVFAAGRVDVGTAVLFRSTEPPSTGTTFLDLGCGYGLIACALAATRPQATVWGVDVNRRALRLTGENAARVGAAGRLHASPPDAVPPGLVFDQIWSNPPVRIGKPALHALLLHWLPRLSPGGAATLVVGRNLGADSLQRWLRDQGYACDRLASAKGFRVLRARAAPERAPGR